MYFHNFLLNVILLFFFLQKIFQNAPSVQETRLAVSLCVFAVPRSDVLSVESFP